MIASLSSEISWLEMCTIHRISKRMKIRWFKKLTFWWIRKFLFWSCCTWDKTDFIVSRIIRNSVIWNETPLLFRIIESTVRSFQGQSKGQILMMCWCYRRFRWAKKNFWNFWKFWVRKKSTGKFFRKTHQGNNGQSRDWKFGKFWKFSQWCMILKRDLTMIWK